MSVLVNTKLAKPIDGKYSVCPLTSTTGATVSTSAQPMLYMDFLQQNYYTRTSATGAPTYFDFSDKITFSRADATAVATQYGPDGLLRLAPLNINLYSQDFSATGWVSNNASTTLTANAATAPDGTSTAGSYLCADTTDIQRRLYPAANITVTPGAAYTWSVYVKPVNWTYLGIALSAGTAYTENAVLARLNMQTLQFAGVVTGTGGVCSFKVEKKENGWLRIIVSGKIGASTGYRPKLSLLDANETTSNPAVGVIGAGIYVWGAQLELGTQATPYIATTNAPVSGPRFDYDPITKAPIGWLLEMSSQNLLLNSTIDGANLATQSVTVTAVPHTLTFYGTGTVVLSGTYTGTLVGSGAYPTRSTLTFTPTAGTLTLTVSGAVQFAQLEAQPFSTSYIPTAGSPVTRADDVASMTGTNFTSWFNATQGTLFAEGDVNYISGTSYGVLARIDNGATTNSIVIAVRNSQTLSITSSSVVQAAFTPATAVINTPMTLACAYSLDNSAGAANGLVGQTDTACTMPLSLSRMLFGTGSSTVNLVGHIKRIGFYNVRQSNAVLSSLTS